MKLIHTADWHLGCTIYDRQRLDEQRRLIARITDIACAERPDAFIISGDIFDTATPSSRIQRMFVDAVDRLHEACPEMAIVIVAGNHDSGTRHEIFATPWRRQGIYLIGDMPADIQARDSLIITVPGRGYIVALPYLNVREMHDKPYHDLIARAESRNTQNLPVIATGHIAVTGCDATGHPSDRLTIGNIDCHGTDVFGDGADYVALGHIHRPQTLAGTGGRIRYAGSPMQISFDEKWPHSLSVVEVRSHGDTPDIREIILEPDIPLITVPATPLPWDEAIQALAGFDATKPAYLRLNVGQSDPLPPDAMHTAAQICADKEAELCFIHYTRICADETGDDVSHMSVSDLEASTPVDIARMYIESRGMTFDSMLQEMLYDVVRQIEDDSRIS